MVSGLRNKAGESPACTPSSRHVARLRRRRAERRRRRLARQRDQIAAQHIGQDTTLPSIELRRMRAAVARAIRVRLRLRATIAFRTPTQPLPMEHNPRKVFYRLFGQGDTAAERQAIIEETGSILDMVSRERRRPERPARRAATRRGSTTTSTPCARSSAACRSMERSGDFGRQAAGCAGGVPEDFGKQLDMMFDMIALAYQANVTRVTTFMMAKEVSMRTYNQIGVSGCVPSAVASPERSREAGSAREGAGVSREGVRAVPQSARTRRTAMARCSITRSSCTAAT